MLYRCDHPPVFTLLRACQRSGRAATRQELFLLPRVIMTQKGVTFYHSFSGCDWCCPDCQCSECLAHHGLVDMATAVNELASTNHENNHFPHVRTQIQPFCVHTLNGKMSQRPNSHTITRSTLPMSAIMMVISIQFPIRTPKREFCRKGLHN